MACTELEGVLTSVNGSALFEPAWIAGGGLSRQAVRPITEMPWKIDSIVRFVSGGEALRVIGRDSVGSVICRPLNGEAHQSVYVPPTLLVAADAGLA